MLSDDEFDRKVTETLQQASEIINDARSRLADMEQLLKQHNLPADFAERILNSNVVTPEQKARAEQELQSFQEELERDLRAAEELAKSQRRKVKGPRRGMRI